MAESFDSARSGTPDSTSGVRVAGELLGTGEFLQAGYIVFGPDGGSLERVDVATPLPVGQAGGSTSAVTQKDAAPSATTLLAANSSRLGASVFNNTSLDLYLKLGSGASTESFTVKMAAGSYYEVPFRYTGIVTGIWPSAAGSGTADGNAMVTEVSA